VRPAQSRRVDLAYARTDMRSQGRTERWALLALDGIEDMQGGYVQLTRSKERTDLYLTVGPEPLGADEERPHAAREARGSEELLERVLTRDGSKTLASDTQDLPDLRRLSTRQLRAERDRLAQLQAESPPDRSRELHLAAQRAAEAEQARQQAFKERQAAANQLGAIQGRLLRRRDLQPARDRLALAEQALVTTTSQADQTAERLGLLRRAQQRRLGWLEAHDEELRLQERAVAREAAWRRRVDQRALALAPPTWLAAELGPGARRPPRAGGVTRGRRRAGHLPARLRPQPSTAGEASLGQEGPEGAGGSAGYSAHRRAGRGAALAGGAPPQPP
jgi:hypothetical protein